MKLESGQARLIEVLLAVTLVSLFLVAFNLEIGGLGVVNVSSSKPPISASTILKDLSDRGVLVEAFENRTPREALDYIVKAVELSLPVGYRARVSLETYVYDENSKSYMLNTLQFYSKYTHGSLGSVEGKAYDAATYLYLDEESLGATVYLVRVEVYWLGGG